jgi:hypothetical protein
MKIAMYKMITGEIVIGEVIEENEEVLTLKKPKLLMLDPMQGGVVMVPYDAIYTQEELEEFTFQRKFIIHPMTVHQTFEEAYIKQCTGIELAEEHKEIIT